jgi:hypothetical protein
MVAPAAVWLTHHAAPPYVVIHSTSPATKSRETMMIAFYEEMKESVRAKHGHPGESKTEHLMPLIEL